MMSNTVEAGGRYFSNELTTHQCSGLSPVSIGTRERLVVWTRLNNGLVDFYVQEVVIYTL